METVIGVDLGGTKILIGEGYNGWTSSLSKNVFIRCDIAKTGTSMYYRQSS